MFTAYLGTVFNRSFYPHGRERATCSRPTWELFPTDPFTRMAGSGLLLRQLSACCLLLYADAENMSIWQIKFLEMRINLKVITMYK